MRDIHTMEVVGEQWFCTSDCDGPSHLTWIDDAGLAQCRTPELGQGVSWDRHADDSYGVYVDGQPIQLPEAVTGVRFE